MYQIDEKLNINEFTLMSWPIELSNGTATSFGTGFLYHHEGNHYIVTAWHNLTGMDFITKQCLSKEAWHPARAKITLPIEKAHAQHSEIVRFEFWTKLYSDNEEASPIWLVDREQGSRLDIAVVPLRVFENSGLIENEADSEEMRKIISYLNGKTVPTSVSGFDLPVRLLAHSMPGHSTDLKVTDEVYVVGFPQAIAGGEGTAIWKRGTVASEPRLMLRNRPCFLVDTATRPGLSGSPVVAKFVNPSWDNAGRGTLTQIGSRLGFCGLYTSRVGQQTEGAQLGVVWTETAIRNVIRFGVPGLPASNYASLCNEGVDDPIV